MDEEKQETFRGLGDPAAHQKTVAEMPVSERDIDKLRRSRTSEEERLAKLREARHEFGAGDDQAPEES